MKTTRDTLLSFAREIRLSLLDSSYNAHAGHIGSALSIADILAALYGTYLNVSPKNLRSQSRDRFILSKGHAAAALYAALFKKDILTKKQFESFGMDNGGLCEHPERKIRGIEMTGGSLGHGLGFGIGIALGLKKKKIPARVCVLLSDGECGEGSTWEAALLASHLLLDNLTVIIDYNNWQCFGPVDEITHVEPFRKKWEAFGWKAQEVNGHNLPAMQKIFTALPFKKGKSNVIIAKTTMGKGISCIENKLDGHYRVFSKQEYMHARKELEKP